MYHKRHTAAINKFFFVRVIDSFWGSLNIFSLYKRVKCICERFVRASVPYKALYKNLKDLF